jgi:acetoacetate decarboxylase
MGLPFDDGWTIPFDSPHYPPLPARYRRVRSQIVPFQADPTAVAGLLPEPLVADPEGRCVAIGLRVPWSSAYGSFNEAVVELACTLKGRPGWYCSHVLHDGPRGIAAGREIYGTPKVFCSLEVTVDGSVMETRASIDGHHVMSVTSTTPDPIDPSGLPDLRPSWRLKVIPRADAPGPALKQLIDAGDVSTDVVVHEALRGTGTVRFEGAPLLDLSSLGPIRSDEAFAVENSFLEGYGRIELDYLTRSSSTRSTMTKGDGNFHGGQDLS